MGKKHYSQSIKDEAVLFYELGHSFAETQAKYGMAESTFLHGSRNLIRLIPYMRLLPPTGQPATNLSATLKNLRWN